MKANLSETVSGRITTAEKDQMQKLGFTVRDAIQTKILLLMRDPLKHTQLKIKALKEKKQELTYDEIDIDMQIEDLEKRYNKLKEEYRGRII